MGKLFKEFEQINYWISRKYGGTGSGTAHIKKGSTIEWRKSVRVVLEGESAFTFLLPKVKS